MAEKQDFLVSSSITGGSLLSTQKAYFWPKNGVQPSCDNTHDALYLHVPTELPHRPSQLLIHDQTWQEMVDKHVFFQHLSPQPPIPHKNVPYRPTNDVLTYDASYPHAFTQLPYRPQQPLTCDQKLQKIVQKHGFFYFCHNKVQFHKYMCQQMVYSSTTTPPNVPPTPTTPT